MRPIECAETGVKNVETRKGNTLTQGFWPSLRHSKLRAQNLFAQKQRLWVKLMEKGIL